jgi:hypothetical protein
MHTNEEKWPQFIFCNLLSSNWLLRTTDKLSLLPMAEIENNQLMLALHTQEPVTDKPTNNKNISNIFCSYFQYAGNELG